MSARRTGLVISGGGSKGAFAVGVVRRLHERFRTGGWFDVVAGTSTGALIAPLAALGASPAYGQEAMSRLEEEYTTVTTRDILERQSVLELIGRQDCLYESDPLRERIEAVLSPEWFRWLQSPAAPSCSVVYCNYQTGQKIEVSAKGDLSRADFIAAIMASASVPVVMEATTIGGQVCYDGGVRDLLPFAKVIHAGVDTIVPIFLDPETFPSTPQRFRRMDRTLLRTFSILVDEAGRNDLKFAQLINQAVRAKEVLLGEFSGEDAQKIAQVLARPEFSSLFGKSLVRIIDGLRPDKRLTENSLEFDPSQMRHWVALGRAKVDRIVQSSPFR